MRQRLALAVLAGVFLIPVGLSSLRGLTHILTCSEPVAAPFQILMSDAGPVLTGATTLTPEEVGGLCGGLVVDMSVAQAGPGRVALTIPITNLTDAEWMGTVQVSVAGQSIPVDVGRVGSGETRAETLVLRLPEGSVEVDGSLLIGP